MEMYIIRVRKTGSSTSFVIPVEMNKNNSVVGMTTAMSTAHEIKYTILYTLPKQQKANASARANGKRSNGKSV